MFRGLLIAFSFLTRIPVRVEFGATGRTPEQEMASAVPWFPVVGLALGALVGVTRAGAGELLPANIAAGLAVMLGLFLTGAFHHDGLADCFDGLGGGRDKAHVLTIMKDSRLGTYGSAALFVSLGLRWAALAALPGWTAAFVVPAAHMGSRSAAVVVMMLMESAAKGGLGAGYLKELDKRRAGAGAGVGLMISAALLGVGAWALAAAVLPVLALCAWANKRIGGVTGDVLGGVQQVAEISILIAAVVAFGLRIG